MSGWGSIFNNMTYALRSHSATLSRLQEQAATGMRVLRPSDSPVDAFRISGLAAEGLTLESYVQNLDTVVRNLGTASSVLQSVSVSITRVESLLTQGATEFNAKQRGINAAEIDQILEQILSLANTENLGQHLFAGSLTTSAPYVATRLGGEIVSVTYKGSLEEMSIPVALEVKHASLLVGEEVFRSDNRGDPIFYGQTGAAEGAGTSSVRGDVWLIVKHTSTDYALAPGLDEGTSASKDTIMGDHTLNANGPAGTIQLDSGEVLTFDGTETDLKLTNENGAVVYVDASGFDMLNNGDYTITGDGTLSIDDGVTTLAIDFTSDVQPVVDSTGRILYVDSTGIVAPGNEPIRVPGTYDLFGALINARDLLRDTRDLSGQQSELLGQALESVKEVALGLSEAVASTGGRLQAMDTLHDTLGNQKITAEGHASMLQDADIIAVAMELARTQTLYQMSLMTAGKLLSLSLLDYI